MIYEFSAPKFVEKVENTLKMGGKDPLGNELYANNLYLTENGKPVYFVFAEMPIGRVPRIYWEDRILKCKAAGFQGMSSFLFWTYHEFEEGKFDFTGDNDLAYYIELCKKHDMKVFLKIGPWVTSETRFGALPEWLFLNKENGIGYNVRENNPNYLAKVRIWYEKVYEQVEPYLYKNGGNIIAIQIDNELLNGPEHLKTLKDMAIDVGFDVPYYTVTGWGKNGGARIPENEYLIMFGGYPDAPWDKQLNRRKPQGHYAFMKTRNAPDIADQAIFDENDIPDVTYDYDAYPYAMSEMGLGLCVTKHRRPLISAMDNYAMTMTKLGAGMNFTSYYLFAGGRHRIIKDTALNQWYFEKWKNSYAIVSYDFQAPIGASGDLTPSYGKMKLLNYFMSTYGSDICEMQTVFCKELRSHMELDHLRYATRINREGSGYVFVTNHVHGYVKQAISDVQFRMPDGKVIPEKPITAAEAFAFFMPYRIRYGSTLAEYATVQPYTKIGNTYFFVALRDVEPVYKFEGMDAITAKVGKENGFTVGKDTFITLSEEEAERLCVFDRGVCIGDGCDLLETEDGITATGCGDFAYWLYENGNWKDTKVHRNIPVAAVEWEEIEDPGLDRKFFYEIQADCGIGRSCDIREDRQLKFYRVKVDGSNGYIRIRFSGDSAQLYCDGKLTDDFFYKGCDWVVQADLMDGRDCVVVVAEYLHNIYVEVEPKTNCDVHEIIATGE